MGTFSGCLFFLLQRSRPRMSLFGFNFFNSGTDGVSDSDNSSVSTSPFSVTYKCFSQAFTSLSVERQTEIGRGGKILLSTPALERLTAAGGDYPMTFKLTNTASGRETHCGVLEFTSDDGQVIVPHWIMQYLGVNEGGDVKVEYARLPVATYAKFQPVTAAFLQVSDPKAILENAFRTFACLTRGDTIVLRYNNTDYELMVKELKPADAVVIIECDLHFEFEPPEGYEENSAASGSVVDTDAARVQRDVADFIRRNSGFNAFSGSGKRLDGRRRKDSTSTEPNDEELVAAAAGQQQRGLPNYKWRLGELTFLRDAARREETPDVAEDSFEAFGGVGQSLIAKRKKRKTVA